MGPAPKPMTKKTFKKTSDTPQSTDGVGNQSDFRQAVMEWCAYQDAMSKSETRKKYAIMDDNERAILILGQLKNPAKHKVKKGPLKD